MRTPYDNVKRRRRDTFPYINVHFRTLLTNQCLNYSNNYSFMTISNHDETMMNFVPVRSRIKQHINHWLEENDNKNAGYNTACIQTPSMYQPFFVHLGQTLDRCIHLPNNGATRILVRASSVPLLWANLYHTLQPKWSLLYLHIESVIAPSNSKVVLSRTASNCP